MLNASLGRIKSLAVYGCGIRQLVAEFFRGLLDGDEFFGGGGWKIGDLRGEAAIEQKRGEGLVALILQGAGSGGVDGGLIVLTAFERGFGLAHQAIDSCQREVDFEQDGIAKMGERGVEFVRFGLDEMMVKDNEGVGSGAQAGKGFSQILRGDDGLVGGLLKANGTVAGGWYRCDEKNHDLFRSASWRP